MLITFVATLLVLAICLKILPGMEAKSVGALFGMSLLYAIINSVVWWIFGSFLTLTSVLTLGLLGLLVNAGLLFLCDLWVPGIQIKSIFSLLACAFLIALAQRLVSFVF